MIPHAWPQSIIEWHTHTLSPCSRRRLSARGQPIWRLSYRVDNRRPLIGLLRLAASCLRQEREFCLQRRSGGSQGHLALSSTCSLLYLCPWDEIEPQLNNSSLTLKPTNTKYSRWRQFDGRNEETEDLLHEISDFGTGERVPL